MPLWPPLNDETAFYYLISSLPEMSSTDADGLFGVIANVFSEHEKTGVHVSLTRAI
jgi:hypothetical protein